MTLQQLVDAFIAGRLSGGLFLEDSEVLGCAVAAVRYYLGYGSLASLEGAGGDELALVDADTEVTAGEWSIISPLFGLYAERESAMRVESSRGQGVDVPGRTAGEIAPDITMREEVTRQLASVEACFLVGVP